ncbi:MAG: serine/threonine-protein kinase [Anaerolineae bacterium]
MSANRPADTLIGKTLGQFEVIEEIGRGGMATVYRARQKSINRIVALKVLPPSLLHDPSFYERFTREVDVIAHLEHPHIVPIYDYGEAEGIPFIAMRYLAAGSVASFIRTRLPTLAQIERPLSQVAQALDYAHLQGIIHRDLKPGNMLLDEHLNAYLTDFGIARVLNSRLTGSAIIGTPAYMSPEQANGQPVDGRSDVYSLGIVLFEMLTGREPFQADTPLALMLKHMTEPTPQVREFRAELPMSIETVIARSTAKNPDERYQSAADLANAFSDAIRATPYQLDHPTLPPSGLRASHTPTPPPPAMTPRPITGSHSGETPTPAAQTPLAPGRSATPPAMTPPPLKATPTPTRHSASTPLVSAQQANNVEYGDMPTLRDVPAPGLMNNSSIPAAVPVTAHPVSEKRRSPVPLIVGALAVIAVIALVLVTQVLPRVTSAPEPTPFANSQRVIGEHASLNIPVGWSYSEHGDETRRVRTWEQAGEAFFSLSISERGCELNRSL